MVVGVSVFYDFSARVPFLFLSMAVACVPRVGVCTDT